MKKTVFTVLFLFSIFTGFSQTNEEINKFKENNNDLLNELSIEKNSKLNEVITLMIKYNERKQLLKANNANNQFIEKSLLVLEHRLELILSSEQIKKYNRLRNKLEFN